MKKIIGYSLVLLFCFSCGTDVPIYYNTCSKSDFVFFHKIGGMDTLVKNDTLFQLFCEYLSDTKNFTDYKEPRNPRPNDTYRFDFFKDNKRVKSIYIHRWSEPKFYSMDDWGWNKTYTANALKTDSLLKRLEIIPPYY